MSTILPENEEGFIELHITLKKGTIIFIIVAMLLPAILLYLVSQDIYENTKTIKAWHQFQVSELDKINKNKLAFKGMPCYECHALQQKANALPIKPITQQKFHDIITCKDRSGHFRGMPLEATKAMMPCYDDETLRQLGFDLEKTYQDLGYDK